MRGARARAFFGTRARSCPRQRRLLAPLLSCCQDFEWESCAALCFAVVDVVVVVVVRLCRLVVGILVACRGDEVK